MRQLLHVAGLVCTVVGALTLYCLVVGALASGVIRWLRRRRASRLPPPASVERRGRTWADLPAWVHRDRAWAVALVLLSSPGLAERTLPFVDLPARRIDWLGLRLEATRWSRRDQLIIDIAHDLAVGDPAPAASPYPGEHVTVAELLADLDPPHIDLVHAALDLRLGACTVDEAWAVAARTPPDTPTGDQE